MSLSPEDIYHQQMFNDKQIIKKKKPVVEKSKVLLMQSSKLNKKVINYFKSNLFRLNQLGLVFEWIPVDESEVEFYEEQDITKFPALMTKEENIFGLNNIIEFLDNLDKPKEAQAQTIPSSKFKNEPDEMKSYFMSKLDEDDEDEDDKDKNDFSKKAAEMSRMRKSNGQHSSTSSNPEVHEKSRKKVTFKEVSKKEKPFNQMINAVDIVKNNKSSNSEDNDMMQKFWENQEETDL
jgi:hypothetical protein